MIWLSHNSKLWVAIILEVDHLYHARNGCALYDSGKILSGVKSVVFIEFLFHAPPLSQ